ncbi:MAG: aminopeptidase P family protein [Rhodospirillales bacterium]|nr:aminopeptidase P family protein [Alphaproteobacteria bacterium]MCB9987078.1 aminopeptidase P family protein [Rhodospirillales bacterium]USO08159.1 MAG: aminopeptidase P family protein [Rhodospirillales bacterium]
MTHDVKFDPKTPEQRLAAMRAAMRAQGLDAFMVPYADAFQSRNRAADGSDRLRWLTGFRGSAGSAVVTMDHAAVFVDSRYTLSARSQIDTGLYEIVDEAGKVRPEAWARDHLKPVQALGYDPFLHTRAEIDAMGKVVPLKPAQGNPVDAAWGDKGLARQAAIAHAIVYAGRGVDEKIDEICGLIRAGGRGAAAITRPDSVSWLLNLRVPALPIAPVVHGYALVDAEAGHVHLFTDVDCSAPAIAASFGNRVSVQPLAALGAGLAALAGRVRAWGIDDWNTPAWFRAALEGAGAQVAHMPDPVTWSKACKNVVEQAGIRDAHIRDGVAVVRFLHAIDTRPGLREREIEALVLEMRALDPACFTRSFDPIVGFNANGAFVHGQVPDDQIKTVTGDGLLLIDSGGQYLNGTTDITRTVAIGTPGPEMKTAFTLVMRGHIALARAVFPEGTSGGQLDALARAPLWEAGLDYAHGTGHGVGYCLNVHEGPCNFSPKVTRAAEPLKPGILMSVEPGVYLEGKFGIRLENLCLVVPAEDMPGYLRLDPVTLAPFDTRALDLALMRADEKAWLNAYHARVLAVLAPLVPPDLAEWLTGMCAPV